MSSNTKKKINSWKLFSGIVIVVLLLAVTATGILYVKIYEPGKRSADLGRLQQESYQRSEETRLNSSHKTESRMPSSA